MKQLANRMWRYLRLYCRLVKISLMSVIIYRLNSLVMTTAPLVWVATTIVFISIIFKGVSEIAGWSFWEVMLLLGIHELIFVGAWMFFVENLERFIFEIRQGTFDRILLRPVNSRFFVSFNSIDFTPLGDIVNVIILISVSLAHLTIKADVLTLGIFLVSLISSFLLVYLVYFLVCSLSLFFVNAQTFTDWIMEMTDFDRYPAEIYSNRFRFFLFFVLPMLFFAYVPTAILLHKLPAYYVGLGVLLVIWLYIISTILWRNGLKNYSSASS